MLAFLRLHRDVDIRQVPPAIHVPTLVLHRASDAYREAGHGRYLGAHIPEAKYVELAGRDHLPLRRDQDAVLDEVEELLTGHGAARSRTECLPRSCSPTSSAPPNVPPASSAVHRQ